VFLLSNNATLSRVDFHKKVMGLFKKGLEEQDFVAVKRLFKLENCYNAGFVLAHEVAQEIPKESKLIVHATPGVEQELLSHGYTHIDNLSCEGDHT